MFFRLVLTRAGDAKPSTCSSHTARCISWTWLQELAILPYRHAACFSLKRMNVGREKVKQSGLDKQISFAKEDCTSLSFPDNRFDAITVAFGVRNFENLDKGLTEMHRVLKAGGHLVILELSEPETFPMKQLYAIYSKAVIPTIGKLLSKDNSAYTYLPQSIKAFPQGEVMQQILYKAGFSKVTFKRLTLGICTLYFATK